MHQVIIDHVQHLFFQHGISPSEIVTSSDTNTDEHISYIRSEALFNKIF